MHDKERLAMKYALAKFRVYLLGDRPFIVYTDHASLRTAVNSPCVITHGRKQPTPLANNGEVAVFLRGV